MQVDEPSWKIRSEFLESPPQVISYIILQARPCPFFAQGKCYFAKNCNFLHQVTRTRTATRAPGSEGSLSKLDDPDSVTANETYTFPKIPFKHTDRSSRHDSNTYAEQHDTDTNTEASDDCDTSDDEDSPTIRNRILSSTVNTIDSGVSRDSVATVKGDPYGAETMPHVESSYSLSYYHSEHRSRSSFSNRSKSSSSDVDGPLSRSHTPISAISATAQEVEVPAFGGLSRTMPQFTLVG